MQILTKPTMANLDETRDFLLQEANELGTSFINNWNIIESCFMEGRFICAKVDHKIGVFLVWSSYGPTAEIVIMVTRPDMRGHGIGSIFIEKVIAQLTKKFKILVFNLECAPPTSEPFWRKHGFIDYPPNYNFAGNRNVHLFRPMVEAPSMVPTPHPFSCLELWHRKLDDITPEMRSDVRIYLPLDSCGAFISCVAIPVQSDWLAQLTNSDNSSRKGKVKHLFSSKCRIGGFLLGKLILSLDE